MLVPSRGFVRLLVYAVLTFFGRRPDAHGRLFSRRGHGFCYPGGLGLQRMVARRLGGFDRSQRLVRHGFFAGLRFGCGSCAPLRRAMMLELAMAVRMPGMGFASMFCAVVCLRRAGGSGGGGRGAMPGCMLAMVVLAGDRLSDLLIARQWSVVGGVG